MHQESWMMKIHLAVGMFRISETPGQWGLVSPADQFFVSKCCVVRECLVRYFQCPDLTMWPFPS